MIKLKNKSSISENELRVWQEISTLFSSADDSTEAIAKALKETGYSIDELTEMYEEKISLVLWTVPWFSIPPWYFSRESLEKKIFQSKNTSFSIPLWLKKIYIRIATSSTRKKWSEIVSYLIKSGVPQTTKKPSSR